MNIFNNQLELVIRITWETLTESLFYHQQSSLLEEDLVMHAADDKVETMIKFESWIKLEDNW